MIKKDKIKLIMLQSIENKLFLMYSPYTFNSDAGLTEAPFA